MRPVMRVRAHVNNIWLHASVHNHRSIFQHLHEKLAFLISFTCASRQLSLMIMVHEVTHFPPVAFSRTLAAPLLSFLVPAPPLVVWAFRSLFWPLKVSAAEVDSLMSWETIKGQLEVQKHKTDDSKLCVKHLITQLSAQLQEIQLSTQHERIRKNVVAVCCCVSVCK